MYTVKATVYENENPNETIRILTPIFVWFLATMGALALATSLNSIILYIIFILCALAVIPTIIITIKRTRKFRENNLHGKHEARLVLTVRDGILYCNNVELSVFYNEKEDVVDFVYIPEASKEIDVFPAFYATVEPGETAGLLEFLKVNGITVDKE